MSWDWEKTLSDIGEDIGSVVKAQYTMAYAKEAQSLATTSVSQIVIPLAIVGIIFLMVWKWKR